MPEEINYASVVFKNKRNFRHEAQKEEAIVYDEVKVPQKKVDQAADGLLADQKAINKRHFYQLMACCLGIFCVILLFGIIAVSVYLYLYYHENNERELLLEINHNLIDFNIKLSSENEGLRRDNDNQTVIIGNLTQKYNVSEIKIEKLTAENQELNTQNQQLETQKNNLTEKIRNMENKVTVTQQDTVTSITVRDGNRQCKPCLDGWLHHQSSCYLIHNPDTAGQKTWEEAQEYCREHHSDLAVIVNVDEKTFISDKSWGSSGDKGYWIGLKAEAEEWKWTDGSDLAEKSWMTQPANNGYCAISVQNQGWKSVSCGDKNRWICKRAALSV